MNRDCIWLIKNDDDVVFFSDHSFDVVYNEYYDQYEYYVKNDCYVDFKWVF